MLPDVASSLGIPACWGSNPTSAPNFLISLVCLSSHCQGLTRIPTSTPHHAFALALLSLSLANCFTKLSSSNLTEGWVAVSWGDFSIVAGWGRFRLGLGMLACLLAYWASLWGYCMGKQREKLLNFSWGGVSPFLATPMSALALSFFIHFFLSFFLSFFLLSLSLSLPLSLPSLCFFFGLQPPVAAPLAASCRGRGCTRCRRASNLTASNARWVWVKMKPPGIGPQILVHPQPDSFLKRPVKPLWCVCVCVVCCVLCVVCCVLCVVCVCVCVACNALCSVRCMLCALLCGLCVVSCVLCFPSIFPRRKHFLHPPPRLGFPA